MEARSEWKFTVALIAFYRGRSPFVDVDGLGSGFFNWGPGFAPDPPQKELTMEKTWVGMRKRKQLG